MLTFFRKRFHPCDRFFQASLEQEVNVLSSTTRQGAGRMSSYSAERGRECLVKTQLSSKRLPNYAIGAEEAAAIMGLHRSQPKKMWQKGFSCRVLSVHETREFAVFSLRECMENWNDYWEGRTSRESGRGRPRTREDEHDTRRSASTQNRKLTTTTQSAQQKQRISWGSGIHELKPL